MSPLRSLPSAVVIALCAIAAACGAPRDVALPPTTSGPGPVTPPPVPQPQRPGTGTAGATDAGTTVAAPPIVAPPVTVDPLGEMSIDAVNQAGALKPVFFALDGDQLDDLAQQ